MVDIHVKSGARVVTVEGYIGTITHIFSGSLAGAIEVTADNGRKTIERRHTLQLAQPQHSVEIRRVPGGLDVGGGFRAECVTCGWLGNTIRIKDADCSATRAIAAAEYEGKRHAHESQLN